MSDRDKLAEEIWEALWPGTSSVMHDEELRAERVQVNRIMSAVRAAGWRKKPSREAVMLWAVKYFGDPDEKPGEYAEIADSILALMDGGSDDR